MPCIKSKWFEFAVSLPFYLLAAATYSILLKVFFVRKEAECQLVYFLMRSLNPDKCADTPNQQETWPNGFKRREMFHRLPIISALATHIT